MISQYVIVLTVFLAAIFVDIYCVRDLQRNENLYPNSSIVPITQKPFKSTTPGNRRWIQQNNIWIRNEQAASASNARNPDQQGSKDRIVNSNQQDSKDLSVNSNQQGSKDRNVNSNQQGPRDRTANSYASIASSNPQGLKPQDGNSKPLGFRGRIITSNPQGSMTSSNSNKNVIKEPIKKLENDNNADQKGSRDRNVNSNQQGSRGQTANSYSSIASSNPQGLRPPDGNSNQLGSMGRIITSNPQGPPKKPENDNKTPDETQSTNVVKGDVSDEELREFSEKLLQKDTNNAMQYVTLNLQGMTTSRSTDDAAPLPLLTLKEDTYKIPSIEKIMLLYNNYFLDAGQNEVYTGQERIEENNLLDTVLATPVMQYARNFLVQKGKIGKDPKEFKDLLRLIWFNMYSRGQGRIGSSGFEHVFLVEIKNNQVSGLHNWLYFYEQEKQRRANYLGYLKKIDLGEKGAIVKYHFTFDDIDKPVGSMFIGTSPELEMALYSTCFILRADKICPLKMNGNRFIIRTYSYRYRGKNMIGSAFPEI